jgi:hypothetical protein
VGRGRGGGGAKEALEQGLLLEQLALERRGRGLLGPQRHAGLAVDGADADVDHGDGVSVVVLLWRGERRGGLVVVVVFGSSSERYCVELTAY